MTAPAHRRWYGLARWRKRRVEQLAREPWCASCVNIGRRTPATVADHIEPHRGDEAKFWTGALQSLCLSCHNRHKQSVERGGSPLLAGCDADGWPLDRRHWWNRKP